MVSAKIGTTSGHPVVTFYGRETFCSRALSIDLRVGSASFSASWHIDLTLFLHSI